MKEINFETILTPLKVIDTLFKADSEEPVSHQVICDLIKTETAGFVNIPWLTPETIPLAKHNQLVRIRGMIQDMSGVEPYADRYKIVGSDTTHETWCHGRFRDRIEVTEETTITVAEDCTALKDRHVLIATCIAPSQSEFLKEEVFQYVSKQWNTIVDNCESMAKNGENASTKIVVKCYDQDFSGKLNDVFDFIGIINLDSCVNRQQTVAMDTTQGCNFEFELPWYYRESMPTLHVIHCEKIAKQRDALRPFVIPDEMPYRYNSEVRDKFFSCLSYAVGGDRLTSEFLLCHLISSIYGRSGAVVLGNMSINVCGVAPDSSVVKNVCDLLQKTLPHLEVIQVSIEELNKPPSDNGVDMLPKFIPADTRLKPGRLQLPRGTQLLIDETRLEAGKLDENGIKVLTALGDIALFQRMHYDFVYYQKEFDAEYNVCVFSDYKSLIKCAAIIPLVPSVQPTSVPSCEAVDFYQMAVFLAGARDAFDEFELSPDMQEMIANDFANIRKEMGGTAFTADDLSQMIVLARWLTISLGSRELTGEIWNKAKAMERERRERLEKFTKRPVEKSY